MKSNASSGQDSQDSDIERFLPIINMIDLGQLSLAATRIRLNQVQSHESAQKRSTDLTCHVQQPPLIGSYNMVYVIVFSDGLRWTARIPGSGVSSFGQHEEQMLMTSIRTTGLIGSSTTIPVPRIHGWNLDRNNLVRVPYLLASFIEGKLLSETWSGYEEAKKVDILKRIAHMMSQLHTFQFNEIGSLVWKSDELKPDVDAITGLGSTYEELWDGVEPWGTPYVAGPFQSTKEYLLDMLDEPEEPQGPRDEPKASDWGFAETALLRRLIESIPQSLDKPHSFVLGHPDFNYQNIFVSDNGEITGFIDWDGVHTNPRALGFARYPSWITRDWDPVRYGYGQPDCRDEDSPEQLVKYRQEYAAALEACNLPRAHYSPEDTKLSHLLEAVDIAVADTICRPWIISLLLRFSLDDKVPFTFREFCDAWLEGNAGEWVHLVENAFKNMWYKDQDQPQHPLPETRR